uniref:Uncharacterized protein n=1 Tax=Octopus bimaculoides TaxID=37653 RepID=A0A0L8HZ96_OCTBM
MLCEYIEGKVYVSGWDSQVSCPEIAWLRVHTGAEHKWTPYKYVMVLTSIIQKVFKKSKQHKTSSQALKTK